MFLDICVSAVFSIRYNMTLEYISDSQAFILPVILSVSNSCYGWDVPGIEKKEIF